MYIECKDEFSGFQGIKDCQILKEAGKCESNDVAKQNCRETCGLCKKPGKRTVFTL